MLTTRWKWAAGAGVVILAFAVGRYTAREPDVRLEEKIRVETVEVFSDRQAWVLRLDTETTHDAATYRHRTRTVEPSGRVEESETEMTATSDTLRQAVAQAGQRETQAAKVEKVYVDRTVTVSTPLPDWRVGGIVARTDAGFSYGPQVSWRVLGPVYASGAVAFGAERVAVVGAGMEF